jgi:hypothetical protein
VRPSDQLDLGLVVESCNCCDDERYIEPPLDCMDQQPCPRCAPIAEWRIWVRNPYGLPSDAACDRCGARMGWDAGLDWCGRCRARQYAAAFHQPERVGQLALGRGFT